MFSFHKNLIPMSEKIKEYIRKSNEQYIEQIIKKNKNDKKYLLTNELTINPVVPSNNNPYFILFGLLTMSISSGIYFLLRKK
jgi:LPXTG-motif cell wall-anchored protein